MEMNIGDVVQYVRHSHHENDTVYFKIGKLYKIHSMTKRSTVYSLDINDIGRQVFDWQVKKIDDNVINRMLYPEVDWSKYV